MIIKQEPDHVPEGLLTKASVLVFLAIAASIGATLLLGIGSLGEVLRIDTSPPSQLDQGAFEVQTEWERSVETVAQRLRSYGWVDRSRGIVHVPIEVATELYLGDHRW